MTTPRLLAIVAILFVASVAWFILGASVTARTGEFDSRLSEDVIQVWGGPHRQVAPTVLVEREGQVTETVQEQQADGRKVARDIVKTVINLDPIPLASSGIEVKLSLDHRQKGLLWYDTYSVAFAGRYTVRNPDNRDRILVARLAFPSKAALYDQFAVQFNGVEAPPLTDLSRGIEVRASVPAGGAAELVFRYESRGLDEWRYALVENGIGQVRDLNVRVTTDFDAVDFPPGTMSPTRQASGNGGRTLEWTFESLVTGQSIGIDLPEKLNPGPLAARLTFFAPVSLLFFVTVLVILGVLRAENLHPVNYAFVSAAFFAFHLLLAYLVDHVQIHAAFAVSALTSIALVVSYLRLVVRTPRALLEAAAAQLVFLVFFSYAFFFEGYTGLTVTIGAIVTLFVMMQATAGVDWGRVFDRQAATS